MRPKQLMFLCFPLLVLLLPGVVWGQSSENSAESFSETNQMLFFDDHLAAITAPTSLVYQYKRQSTFENDESFEDLIKVNIESLADDRKSGTVDYFTGERKRFAPEFNGVIGNPILTIALQRDIFQMERMLNNGTGWRHFQKRLKVAFEETAEIIETEIEYQGDQVPAKDIVIQPFLNDPLSKRFPVFKDKTYIFTMSEKVPGTIYRILAQVDKNVDGNSLTESYTFTAP